MSYEGSFKAAPVEWRSFLAGRPISLENYGASAGAVTLFREFGFTPEFVSARAHESIKAAGAAAAVTTKPNLGHLDHASRP